MKAMIFLLPILLCFCDKDPKKVSSIELITEPSKQDTIFSSLLTVTDNTISANTRFDSLAFLILPLQASCPSCRKKTVDSIIKYSTNLLPNHFIILSARGGKKAIGSYFKEENADVPSMPNQIFLDSTDQASSFNLCNEKPTMYYTCNNKAFKKVASVPSTVKEDLHQFFSGKHYAE